MKNTTFFAAALLVAAAPFCAQAAVVFSDNFDTDGSANYDSVLSASEATVSYSYDYTSDMTGQTGVAPFSIPTAPGATGKTALRLEVNPTAGVPQGITIYPKQTVATGKDIKVTAYVFPRVNPDGSGYTGGSGSSQAWVVGLNTSGTKMLNAYQANLGGTLDGYFFGTMGDIGFASQASNSSQANYFVVEGNTAGVSDIYGMTGATWTYADGADGGMNDGTGFDALFAPPTYGYYGGGGGATGDAWTKVELYWHTNTGTLDVSLNDTLVVSYVDADSTFNAGGRVGIGLYDATSSVAGAGNGYTLFDSLSVEELDVPVETSARNWSLYE